MRTTSPRRTRQRNLRQRLAILAIPALILVSAALDRRNVVFGRETAEPQHGERSVPAPTSEELVREMLSHD